MRKRRQVSEERSRALVEQENALDLGNLSLFALLEYFSKDIDRVELALDCYHRGREAFPRIEWNRVDFTRMCFERWKGRSVSELTETLSEFGRAEEYLVRACLARAPGAAETLDRVYLSKASAKIRRICKSRDLADDALQSLWEKLLLSTDPKLRTYESRGELAAWLNVVASREALDLVRTRSRRTRLQESLEENDLGSDLGPEVDYGARELVRSLRRLIQEALSRLPEHLRFVLEQSVFFGWSIDRIGEALATHRSTSARWLLIARTRVEKEVRGALAREMGFGPIELRRILRPRSEKSDSFSPLFELAFSGSSDFFF